MPRSQFASHFAAAKAAGLHSVPHSGESTGPQSVWDALTRLGAERIGHGVRSTEDSALVAELAARNIVLEICPTSNLQTAIYKTAAAHPLKNLVRAGIRTTINTDNPSISQTTLSHEFTRAAEGCGLTLDELRQCALNAARAAYLNTEERNALAARIAAAWTQATM